MSLITTNIELAALELLAGRPVAIPTETVYGLAALIDNEEAITNVFTIKNRPLNHPLIVHIAPNWDLNLLAEKVPAYAQQLIKEFWPGPLTLVLNAKTQQINPLITGGQNTIAIRCPAHPMTQKLLEKLNIPVVAPSANSFGKISPTTALHVKKAFHDQELTILDGGRCRIGIESTIVDATQDKRYQILRHGIIDELTLASVVSTEYSKHENAIRVPGALKSHYQPQKKLYYFDRYEPLDLFCHSQKGEVYVIASKKPRVIVDEQFYPLSDQPELVAFDLYYQLRNADESKANYIAIELPPATSKWYGIRERIIKAGSPYPT